MHRPAEDSGAAGLDWPASPGGHAVTGRGISELFTIHFDVVVTELADLASPESPGTSHMSVSVTRAYGVQCSSNNYERPSNMIGMMPIVHTLSKPTQS